MYLQTIEGLVAALVTWGLGLVALALGALLNARLNRVRDDRVRSKEADAVAAALYGEVLLIQQEVAKAGNVAARIEMEHSHHKKFDRFFLEENPISEPALYNALAPKLGLLPASEVLAFTKFHAQVKELRWWMPRIGEDKERPYEYNILHLLLPVRDAIQNIAPTLRYIEGRLGIARPAVEPDIERVHTLVAMEEDRLEFLKEQGRPTL